MFECYECDFRVETIGELNIHSYGNHSAGYFLRNTTGELQPEYGGHRLKHY